MSNLYAELRTIEREAEQLNWPETKKQNTQKEAVISRNNLLVDMHVKFSPIMCLQGSIKEGYTVLDIIKERGGEPEKSFGGVRTLVGYAGREAGIERAQYIGKVIDEVMR